MSTAIASPRSGRPVSWWGTVAMITTESVLFALLLFAYVQLWIDSDRWPLGDIAEPELVKSGFRTVVLLCSSIPMHVAERAADDGDQRRLRRGLAIGWLMGAIFLAGHFDEWHTTLQEFTPATNAYGSLFYTVTGFHMVHLVIGLAVTAYLWVGAVGGRYRSGSTNGIRNGVAYWHFVDAVWVAVYGLLYLAVSLP